MLRGGAMRFATAFSGSEDIYSEIQKADYQSTKGFKECTLPPNNIKQAILQSCITPYLIGLYDALSSELLHF